MRRKPDEMLLAQGQQFVLDNLTTNQEMVRELLPILRELCLFDPDKVDEAQRKRESEQAPGELDPKGPLMLQSIRDDYFGTYVEWLRSHQGDEGFKEVLAEMAENNKKFDFFRLQLLPLIEATKLMGYNEKNLMEYWSKLFPAVPAPIGVGATSLVFTATDKQGGQVAVKVPRVSLDVAPNALPSIALLNYFQAEMMKRARGIPGVAQLICADLQTGVQIQTLAKGYSLTPYPGFFDEADKARHRFTAFPTEEQIISFMRAICALGERGLVPGIGKKINYPNFLFDEKTGFTIVDYAEYTPLSDEQKKDKEFFFQSTGRDTTEVLFYVRDYLKKLSSQVIDKKSRPQRVRLRITKQYEKILQEHFPEQYAEMFARQYEFK